MIYVAVYHTECDTDNIAVSTRLGTVMDKARSFGIIIREWDDVAEQFIEDCEAECVPYVRIERWGS